MKLRSYAAGICWANASQCDEKTILIRNRHPEKLSSVAKITGKTAYFLRSRETWCIKISPRHPFGKYLISIGWQGRMNSDRGMPTGEIDLEAWLRGYCSVMAHVYNRRTVIFGCMAIMKGINDLLGYIGVLPKTVQVVQTYTGRTYALYFQGISERATLKAWLSFEPPYLEK